jgi:GTP pyrophosphokinase
VKTADDEKRNRVAREVFDIYAPLAHRLGIGHIKWELEDLSFRYLEPDQYKQIAKLLHERRLDRERFISDVMSQLKNELQATGVDDISGRAKHIYSIWRKMQRKGLEFSQIYDVPCACWSRKCATATPRWASSTPCGGTSRKSSTTTSPTPRRTATARCTRR